MKPAGNFISGRFHFSIHKSFLHQMLLPSPRISQSFLQRINRFPSQFTVGKRSIRPHFLNIPGTASHNFIIQIGRAHV